MMHGQHLSLVARSGTGQTPESKLCGGCGEFDREQLPSEELMIRITYIDQRGMIQHSMTRTTVGIAEFEAHADLVLGSMRHCFETLGGEVISALVVRELGGDVVDLSPSPKLRLIG